MGISLSLYAILDRQAEEVGTAHPLESKRKRTRIARKDTDRVYSVHGEEGENFDMQKNKTAGASVQTTLFKDLPEQQSSKKAEMTPEMLADRERILADTVELMSVKDRFKLDISVSDAIYNKKG